MGGERMWHTRTQGSLKRSQKQTVAATQMAEKKVCRAIY